MMIAQNLGMVLWGYRSQSNIQNRILYEAVDSSGFVDIVKSYVGVNLAYGVGGLSLYVKIM